MKFWKKLVSVNFLCDSRFLKNTHWLNPHCLPLIRNQFPDSRSTFVQRCQNRCTVGWQLALGAQRRANVGSTSACATFYFLGVKTYRANIGQKYFKKSLFLFRWANITPTLFHVGLMLAHRLHEYNYYYAGVTFPQNVMHCANIVSQRWTNKACFIQLTLAQRMYAIRVANW